MAPAKGPPSARLAAAAQAAGAGGRPCSRCRPRSKPNLCRPIQRVATVSNHLELKKTCSLKKTFLADHQTHAAASGPHTSCLFSAVR